MIFLGQASNYSLGRVLRHLFAHGRAKDNRGLKEALAQRYQVEKSSEYEMAERVELYHTGRSALAAAFVAVAPKGSQVIIPGLTCIAVVRAVRAAGCEPVFVDIDPKTLQYDWQSLDKTLKVCYNVSTIVAQNTLGLPLDMARLEKVAKKHHLVIVEDLAHSAGRFYADGRETGSVGVATALSFGKGKAIDTIAGGALVLRSAQYVMPSPPRFRAKRSARWRERWYPALGTIIRAGSHVKLGKVLTVIFLKLGWIERSADAELNLDVKLEPWQAKLAMMQLESLPRTAQQQTKVLRGVRWGSLGASGFKAQQLVRKQPSQNPVKAIGDEIVYPLREYYFVKQRDQFLAECESRGFCLNEIWYDTPVSPVRYAKEANFPNRACPNTVKVAKTIINLPTWYPEAKLAPMREIVGKYALQGDGDE